MKSNNLLPKKGKLFNEFSKSKTKVIPEVPIVEIQKNDWRDKYPPKETTKPYNLENSADDSTLNRMIQLKNFDPTKQIQGKPGSLYFDKSNKKVKIFISEADGWKDLVYV